MVSSANTQLEKSGFSTDNLVQIHGTKDHIFPSRKLKANYTINNTGHFMIISHARKVSEIIRKILLGKNESD